MMKQVKILISLISSILILIISISTSYAEEHILEVSIPINEDIKEHEILKNCFSISVLDEIKNIIPFKLSSEKETILLNLIKEKVDDFVLYYKEKAISRKDNILKKQISVSLDTQQIKNFLKNFGLFYTNQKAWRCFVDTSGLDEEAHKLFQNLILASNCNFTENQSAEIKITVTYNASSKIYLGKMSYKDYQWECMSNKLYILWKKLWLNFIKITDIKKDYTTEVKLTITGFGSVSELKKMNRLLERKLIMCMDTLDLAEMIIKGSGIVGIWRVIVLNPKVQRLKKMLEEIINSKALGYSLD